MFIFTNKTPLYVYNYKHKKYFQKPIDKIWKYMLYCLQYKINLKGAPIHAFRYLRTLCIYNWFNVHSKV